MLPLISSCSPMRFLRAGIRCSGKSPKHLLLVAPGALGRCLCPDGVHPPLGRTCVRRVGGPSTRLVPCLAGRRPRRDPPLYSQARPSCMVHNPISTVERSLHTLGRRIKSPARALIGSLSPCCQGEPWSSPSRPWPARSVRKASLASFAAQAGPHLFCVGWVRHNHVQKVSTRGHEGIRFSCTGWLEHSHAVACFDALGHVSDLGPPSRCCITTRSLACSEHACISCRANLEEIV